VLRTPASALSPEWLDKPVCLRVSVLFCCFAVPFDCRTISLPLCRSVALPLSLPRLSLLFFGKEVHISALFCTFLLVSHAMELEVAASSCP
jgi:hypothetical protein